MRGQSHGIHTGLERIIDIVGPAAKNIKEA